MSRSTTQPNTGPSPEDVRTPVDGEADGVEEKPDGRRTPQRAESEPSRSVEVVS